LLKPTTNNGMSLLLLASVLSRAGRGGAARLGLGESMTETKRPRKQEMKLIRIQKRDSSNNWKRKKKIKSPKNESNYALGRFYISADSTRKTVFGQKSISI